VKRPFHKKLNSHVKNVPNTNQLKLQIVFENIDFSRFYRVR